MSSLRGRHHENALTCNRHEDMFVFRICSYGMAPKRDRSKKLFGGSTHYGQFGILREIVVVRPRVIPDLVCICTFGNDLSDLPSSRINTYATQATAYGHQQP